MIAPNITATPKETAIEQPTDPVGEPLLRVCFVCSGNTCRSPMAEAVTNALAKRGDRRIQAISAGLYPSLGEPISTHAAEALEALQWPELAEGSYRSHRAQAIERGLVKGVDLLIGMTPAHAMELLMRYPEAANQIRCMPTSIADPYGGSLADYQACLEQILEGITSLFFLEEHK